MAAGTTNLKQARQEVLRQLYAEKEVLIGTASGGSVSTIIDVGTTDGVTLESGLNTTQDLVGSWAYVAAVAAPKSSRITAYDVGTGTLTLSPALGATASAQ